MPGDPTDALLRIVEAQPSIGGRFNGQQRLAGGQEGNFSLVFRATDKVTGDPVALKFYRIHGPGDDPYRRASFEREARILERMRGQPNIIQLVHPRTTITIPLVHPETGLEVLFPLEFFALEWAKSSLETCIAQGGSNPRVTIRQFRDVCKGFQRLHARRVCHRDPKPGNCLVLPGGCVAVGDLGTAHDYGDGTPPLRARYDRPVGDVWYTGLELLCGLGDDLGLVFRSEFFGLGAILFELATLNQLAPYLYGEEALELAQHLRAISAATRRTVFDGLISSLVERWPLPDIRDFDTAIPAVIRDRVNRLYQGLAHLDYRRRLTDFTVVFRELEICSRLLERERAYKRWMVLKRQWREAREAKHQRSQRRRIQENDR